MAHIGREKKLADKKAMIMAGKASAPAGVAKEPAKYTAVATKANNRAEAPARAGKSGKVAAAPASKAAVKKAAG